MATLCPMTVVRPPATLSRTAARPPALAPRSAGMGWSSMKGATMATRAMAMVLVDLQDGARLPMRSARFRRCHHERADHLPHFLLGGDFYAATISGSNNAITAWFRARSTAKANRSTPAWRHRHDQRVGHECGQLPQLVPGRGTADQQHLRIELLLHNNGNGAFVNWGRTTKSGCPIPMFAGVRTQPAPTATLPAYVNDGTMHCFRPVHALGHRQHESLRGRPGAGPGQPTLLPARQRAA